MCPPKSRSTAFEQGASAAVPQGDFSDSILPVDGHVSGFLERLGDHLDKIGEMVMITDAGLLEGRSASILYVTS